jgi:uncharacterized protein (UPF0332 family)
MSFENLIKEGFVKKVPIDIFRAKSLIKSSEQALSTAKIIPFKEETLKTIFRELYESLREYCEALGYIKGYRFLNHESIANFLDEILSEKEISLKFDRYRKLRNGINYYGNTIEMQTLKGALIDIPSLINKLKRHLTNNNSSSKHF